MNKMKKMLALVLTLVMVVTLVPALSNKTDVKAAASFKITTPTANQLVAAGYIDIEWTAATGGTVKDYQVYIDNALVGTTNSTSYEYYTTKVKSFNVYVKANYSNNTSESSDTITFGVSKKGLGLASDMGRNLDLRGMGVAWYYNWGEGPSSGDQYTGVEYVPMVWKETNANNFKRRVESAKSKGYKYILTFNEPDLAGQCDMPMNDVYNVWKGIAGMEGINISSPVTAQWPSNSPNWFQPFMTQVDENGDYMPDFISIHCYPDGWGGAGMAKWFLEDIVDWTWNKYGLPIWVTEFSTTGSAVTATGGNGTKEFWEAVMPGLDEREYVERYAAFGFNAANNPNTGLWNYSTGELTPGGEVYKTYGNPEGFTAALPPEPDYKVVSAKRSTLLDDSKVINNVTCEDYVNKDGVSVTASSEANNAGAAANAIDDDIASRWESKHGEDPGILTIDLGATRNIKEVDVVWENASASEYKIEVSNDNQTWTTVAEVTGTGGRCDMVTLKNQASGRYVRINGTSRSTDYGYSIFDIAVYGTTDTKVDETTAPPTTVKPTTAAPTSMAVDNVVLITNILNNNKWKTYKDDGWAGSNGTITAKDGVINGTFTTTGGGWADSIWGIQANAEDIVAQVGNEYTYSASIKATKNMTIRVKVSGGSDDNIYSFDTINLVAGQVYDYTTTFTAQTGQIDIAYALGGGPEGPTTDVSFAIFSNNLVNNSTPPADPETTTVAPTTVAPTTTTEQSAETTIDIASMKKPRKVTLKKSKKKLAAKKVTVNFKAVKGASGYEIAIFKSKKKAKKDEDAKKAIIVKEVTKIKASVNSKKLKNKKKLFIKVRAFVTVGSGINVYGKWSKIKKVKVKK